jgi:hypothetical protein
LGAGPGVGGVQGKINFSECALILLLQYPDIIQGAVVLCRLGPIIYNLLARDRTPIIRRE